MRKILAVIVTISCLWAARLPAQTLEWTAPSNYGTGDQPTVSINSSGLVIEVHKSPTSNTLFYHVGKLSPVNESISWGKSQIIHISVEAGNPSVALTQNSNVILLFNNGLNLYYMTGTLDPTGSVDQSVDWVVTGLHRYDRGLIPKLSINASGDLVEVHANNLSDNELFYRYGYVDPNTTSPDITWKSGELGHFYEWGEYPEIAINDQSNLVEVHSETTGSNLHYRRALASNDRLQFAPPQFLPSTGSRASIALANSELAITVINNTNVLYATAGYLNPADPAKVDWGPFAKLQDGAAFPAVATNSDWIIAVWTRHSFDGYRLQYSLSRVP
jgi:hypothetical protein